MEFVIGGLAATTATVLTNPVEVVKHHMEISRKSQFDKKYGSFFQAGFRLAKQEGFKSLQKGLSPALCAHLMSYGVKLGSYQFGANRGITKDSDGGTKVMNSVCLSGIGGLLGQFMSNPFYLVKVQHYLEHGNTKEKNQTYLDTARKIFKENGIKGFFKGASTCVPRAFIGTSQLTSFAVTKESLTKMEMEPFYATVVASIVAGLALTIAMTPFETVLNKMYKKAKKSKSAFRDYLDSAKEIYSKHGLNHFYRGIGPVYIKIGPHTVLCLVVWEQFKQVYDNQEFSLSSLYDTLFIEEYKYNADDEFHANSDILKKFDDCWN